MRKSKDKYKSMEELKKKEIEGEDYLIRNRTGLSEIAIIAPHGGSIEPGTSELADKIAGDKHFFHSFEGTKSNDNFKNLHVKSTKYDEPDCLAIVKQSERVIAIHGCNENDQDDKNKNFVYLGGLDQDLKDKIKINLESMGFTVGNTPRHLLGADKDNICNKSKNGSGVQIEIQSGLRKQMFDGNYKKQEGRILRTPVFNNFVHALEKAISEI